MVEIVSGSPLADREPMVIGIAPHPHDPVVLVGKATAEHVQPETDDVSGILAGECQMSKFAHATGKVVAGIEGLSIYPSVSLINDVSRTDELNRVSNPPS